MLTFPRFSLLCFSLLISHCLYAGMVRPVMDASIPGSYAGLTLGMGNNSISTNSVFWVGPNRNLMNPIISQPSFNLAGLLGYGLNVNNNCYLGLEGTVGYDSLNSTTNLEVPNTAEYSFTMQIKRNLFAGAAARFGKLYKDDSFLVFGRVGVDFGWYKASLDTYSPIVAGISGDPVGDFTAVSVAPGIGVEGMLTNQVSVRFEYDYEIGVNSNRFTYIPSVGKENSLEYKPSSGIVRVGFSYKGMI